MDALFDLQRQFPYSDESKETISALQTELQLSDHDSPLYFALLQEWKFFVQPHRFNDPKWKEFSTRAIRYIGDLLESFSKGESLPILRAWPAVPLEEWTSYPLSSSNLEERLGHPSVEVIEELQEIISGDKRSSELVEDLQKFIDKTRPNPETLWGFHVHRALIVERRWTERYDRYGPKLPRSFWERQARKIQRLEHLFDEVDRCVVDEITVDEIEQQVIHEEAKSLLFNLNWDNEIRERQERSSLLWRFGWNLLVLFLALNFFYDLFHPTTHLC